MATKAEPPGEEQACRRARGRARIGPREHEINQVTNATADRPKAIISTSGPIPTFASLFSRLLCEC